MYLKGDIGQQLKVWTTSLKNWTQLRDTGILDECCTQIPSVNEPEDTFGNNSSPKAMLVFMMAIGLIFFIISFFLLDYMGEIKNLTPDREIFLIYFSAYIGMWGVYFASGMSWNEFNFPTLRRLLTETSLQWDCRNTKGDDAPHFSIPFNQISSEPEEAYRRKASTAIIALAMLVSATLIELLVANVIYMNMNFDFWDQTILVAVILSEFTAFVCFIIAVDALESLFNRFKTKEWTHLLMNHFYSRSINPRYAGFAFLIGGTVLLISIHNPLLASSTVGIIFFTGSAHWFPSAYLLKKKNKEYDVYRLVFRGLIFLAVIFPLIVLAKD